MIRETVIQFLQRISDYVIAGNNNTRIVLGTDRKGIKGSGYGDGGKNQTGAGSIDIVAGGSQNVDYENDRARLLLSSKSDPDDYFGISVGDVKTNQSVGAMKADNIYLVAREDIKIVGPDGLCVLVKKDGSIDITCGASGLVTIGGGGVADFVAQAAKTDANISALQSAHNSHIHPAGTPSTGPTLQQLSSLPSVASLKVKAE